MPIHLAEVTQVQVLVFSLAVIGTFFLLAGTSLFLHWLQKKREKGALCPYTGKPVRRASELSYWTSLKVLKFLYNFHQYDNRLFDLSKAVISRETGRIFQDCINIFDVIELDWSFLNKRYSGTYVSWGSLTPSQQEAIRQVHGTLDEFQTEESSSLPAPRQIEKYFAYTVPGPLYVDLETKVLLGWQCVPDTELEVLIVQKPLQIHHPTIDEK